LIRDRLDQGFQEARGGFDVGGFVQLGEGDLGRSIHGYEKLQFAFFGTQTADPVT
jgi:hypothetical protein